MAAKDLIHDAVRNALIKDGWTISADPYVIEYEDLNLFADMAAERPLAAERGEQRIVVEVKSFLGPSPIHDLQVALGQYEMYRGLLELTAPDRKLFLAVDDAVYKELFCRKAIQVLVHRYDLSLLVVRTATEEIVQWTS